MGSKPTVLLILDGYGIAKNNSSSAIEGHSPNIEKLKQEYPWVEAEASGLDVGLPEGQMGNSEVGHCNIGAGRVVNQPLVMISKSIKDGSFFENKVLNEAIDNCIEKNSNLHIYGLLSDGDVHAHNEHLYALLELIKQRNLDRVYIHPFLDGRDTPPKSAERYLKELEQKIEEIGVGRIESISGRYYAMDRDNRWDRIELAYDALTLGEGKKEKSVDEAIQNSYVEGVNDEFVIPTIIEDDNHPFVPIDDNDSIVFFNFRQDRQREITRAMIQKDFEGFDRKKTLKKLYYVNFCECDVTIEGKHIAFEQEEQLKNTLPEYLSKMGLKQLHIAETEKYAHVTFFFNGGADTQYEGEDRILVPSPKVATYDLKPEMSVYEVTEKLLEALDKEDYDFVICNFANGDMVGHTGMLDAAQKAVDAIDECTQKVVDKVLELDGQMFICADHGNCEVMSQEDGTPHTAHTTNKVPFILVNYRKDVKLREGGKLGDIAPTLLEMMGIDKPSEMECESLIEHI